ncbi:hypothetical protein PV08_04308 [Exophiala spinifera]|uniref:4a-hydroxytetrahydrobiopterin dehydratase n=1 Tax=Exophiala spinifera TaxID=91928 RepID=A0A0D1ZWR1_9EURO|nr:uncharacterized protein PV08_04308 [Exophiala spinifera]KIW17117.1 hypothetical protein PV08_04308 [Exophiala spinifera]
METPIIISEDRQKITFLLKNGSEITQPFHPTPKAKTEKMTAALASLLSISDDTSTSTNSAPTTPSTSTLSSFGAARWILDPLGDAIHRHLALSSAEECDRVERAIMEEADKMNHHPHIARVSDDNSQHLKNCLTVTCTTHSPRGLSIRDTRLAAKIDELLTDVDVTRPIEGSTPGQDSDQILQYVTAKRETSISENRQKIQDALEKCGCQNAKS